MMLSLEPWDTLLLRSWLPAGKSAIPGVLQNASSAGLASFDFTLSADQLKTREEASRIEIGFPHEFYAREMVCTIAYGGLRDRILA